ncbi:MAG: CRISPR-associated protein Cas4 [Chloroflexota bacterium]
MIPLALGLFVVGVLLLWLAHRCQQDLGLPAGRVIAFDDEGLERLEQALFDRQLGLTGRPDYLVRQRGRVIPVEVKSSPAPSQPHEAHVLQLAAYCALVASAYRVRPRYGVLKYAGRALAIEYTPELERRLRAALGEIHSLGGRTPPRSHHARQRCRACGYRAACDQRLS